MHNYQELTVWKRAVELSVKIYSLTNSFPSEEKFGLVSQIRRSAVSVASNIAEGAGRGTDKDFAHFLTISAGSSFEIETQLLIAQKIGFISLIEFQELSKIIDQIKKMLFALRKKLLS